MHSSAPLICILEVNLLGYSSYGCFLPTSLLLKADFFSFFFFGLMNKMTKPGTSDYSSESVSGRRGLFPCFKEARPNVKQSLTPENDVQKSMCNRKISPNSLPAWWLGQHERQVHFRNRAALSFEWWVEWLLQGLNLWNAEFHAGVHRHTRKGSMAHVRKDLWNGMQINGSNMLSLQIWTQMRKCRRKFCITTLTSHVAILATKCYILIGRTWGIIMCHNYHSLGEIYIL